ncbi:MAG: hypothetical protein ACREFW_04825 [Rhizomicrobium sp.]
MDARPTDTRRAYEDALLSAFASLGRRAAGLGRISSDSLGRETAARRRLEAAIREMWAAIAQVNGCSACVHISPRAFADFLADEVPSDLVWDERLNAARQGWD